MGRVPSLDSNIIGKVSKYFIGLSEENMESLMDFNYTLVSNNKIITLGKCKGNVFSVNFIIKLFNVSFINYFTKPDG